MMNTDQNAASFLEAVDLKPIEEFRTRHHTAVLVVLFTDLKGSTGLAEEKGETYSQKLRQDHDALLRTIIERDEAGEVIKTIGDSFMCVFAEPTAAVQRSLEIQAKIKSYNEAHPNQFPLSVRIGMHMGQVAVENTVQRDVFGRHVNRAARVESLADGGQILLTEPVYDSASGWLSAENQSWADHGFYALKGIREPTHIYEVLSPGQLPNKPPGGLSAKIRWPVYLLGAALLVIAAWFLFVMGDSESGKVTIPETLTIEIDVYRDGKQRPLNEALPLQSEDQFVFEAAFSTKAYGAIIWIDSEGQVDIKSSALATPVERLRAPPNEGGYRFAGPPGWETVIVLASTDPINESKWKQRLANLKPPQTDWKDEQQYAIAWDVSSSRRIPELKSASPPEQIRGIAGFIDRLAQKLDRPGIKFRALCLPHDNESSS